MNSKSSASHIGYLAVRTVSSAAFYGLSGELGMNFAAVFPGQGSQSVGMMNSLADASPIIKETFDEASEVLSKDLWQIVTEGPESLLAQTEITQPLMLAAGVSIWRLWNAEGGPLPLAMAGHSLGEYSALVASGTLDYTTTVSLVAKRSGLMQRAVPDGTGGMAAILGLTADQVIAGCAEASEGEVVEAVNFNSPEQTVIGGHGSAVDRAMEVLSGMGAKRTIKLAMSVPSHCSLMNDVAAVMGEALDTTDFSEPKVPVLHNVNASPSDSVENCRKSVAQQLYCPVRWVDTIQAFESKGADTIIEFGPGKVLFGLNRRINRKLGNLTINDAASFEKALAAAQG